MKKIIELSVVFIFILIVFTSCSKSWCVYCTTDGSDPMTDKYPECFRTEGAADNFIEDAETGGWFSDFNCVKVREE